MEIAFSAILHFKSLSYCCNFNSASHLRFRNVVFWLSLIESFYSKHLSLGILGGGRGSNCTPFPPSPIFVSGTAGHTANLLLALHVYSSK